MVTFADLCHRGQKLALGNTLIHHRLQIAEWNVGQEAVIDGYGFDCHLCVGIG
jgi:hypothetical protein